MNQPLNARSLCTGSLLISNHVFERRRSTRNEPFAILRRDLDQIFRQIVYKRVKTLSSTNLVASRNINIEKDPLPVDDSLPVDVRRSEKSLLKLPIGWFSHDVTKIQTTKLSILLRFYFHDELEQLKTNVHTNFRLKRVLGFVLQYAWIS